MNQTPDATPVPAKRGNMFRYNVVKVIGKGGYGTATLVSDKETGEELVIKTVDLKGMNERDRAGALQEAALLKHLRHPAIIRHIDTFEDGGNLCIVCEYAAKGDLSRVIRRRKGVQFSIKTVLTWFSQLCIGIAHLHRRRVLHRDIKTQNILLCSSRDVKISDFGISRVLNSTLDKANTMIGTPYYLSPEICMQQPYSFKSDVWSLGCVLYELCTLRHPFSGNSIREVLESIMSGRYHPLPSHVPPELAEIIAWMLQLDPERRPTVQHLLDLPILQPFITAYVQRHRSPPTPQQQQQQPAGGVEERKQAPPAEKPTPAGPVRAVDQITEVPRLAIPERHVARESRPASPSPRRPGESPRAASPRQPSPRQSSPEHASERPSTPSRHHPRDRPETPGSASPKPPAAQPKHEPNLRYSRCEDDSTESMLGGGAKVGLGRPPTPSSRRSQSPASHGHNHHAPLAQPSPAVLTGSSLAPPSPMADSGNVPVPETPVVKPKPKVMLPEDPTKFMLEGQTLVLDGIQDDDTLTRRIESLRVYLEQLMGADKFLTVYAAVAGKFGPTDVLQLLYVEQIAFAN